jgi:6-phosphogluconolactonase
MHDPGTGAGQAPRREDTMKMETRVFPDLDALNHAALEDLMGVLDAAVASRGRFAIALSGGHTPAKLYALWADRYRDNTPWDRVHLFWGDERFVPQDDPLSNYRMTREVLISRVPIPAENAAKSSRGI